VRLALAVLLVLTVGACGGSASRIDKAQLPKLVLQPSDLPRAFSRFDEGAQVQADAVAGPRRDAARFGREGGWKARYHRAGTGTTRGALVVESRADVFGDAAGAGKDLDAYRAQLAQLHGRSLAAPKLGDAAAASTQLQAGGIRFYTIAWRDRNTTASVTVDGFDGKVTLADALALARLQERRLRTF
jgi:hypothetical protein